MFEHATAGVLCLRKAVASFEPHCVRGDDAARLVEVFAEAERLAAAGKALAARRVEETNAWRRSGHRSAANWLAAKTGSSVGAAVGALETARRLEDLPATSDAHRAGRLSEAQVREIASAAAAQPAAEADLLGAAATEGLGGLREQCRRARAAGSAADEAAHHRAIHRSRHLRHWTDADGAFRMDLRTTADAGATILAGLTPLQEKAFAAARAAGRREPAEAYAADALVDMAQASGTAGDRREGARAMVHVRVDHSALIRGSTEAGETCEIPGVGPIPVATARAMAADAILEVLVTKGVDVVAVAHGGALPPPPSAVPSKSATAPAWWRGARCAITSRSTMSTAGPSPAPRPSSAWPGSVAGTMASRRTAATASRVVLEAGDWSRPKSQRMTVARIGRSLRDRRRTPSTSDHPQPSPVVPRALGVAEPAAHRCPEVDVRPGGLDGRRCSEQVAVSEPGGARPRGRRRWTATARRRR
jgi:hypothetical protein